MRVIASPTVTPPVPSEFLPTIADLVAVARGGGRSDATARTIRGWRQRGYVSPPTRHGTAYRYPLAALGEVDSYVRWGRRKMVPELLTFARYVEAGTVEPGAALAACQRVLELVREGAADGAALAAKGPEAVRREAERAAKARGRNAILPRRVRMSLDDRQAAFSYMFSFALDMAMDDEERGRFQLERIIGLRAGRAGDARDVSQITGPLEESQVDLDAFDHAVRDASPEAAELSRRFVEIVSLWLPALLPALAAEAGASDRPFLDIARAAAAETVPEIYVALFAWRLARPSLSRAREELAAELEELQPASIFAEVLVDAPERDVELVRAGLRPYQRVQLKVARLGARSVGVGVART